MAASTWSCEGGGGVRGGEGGGGVRGRKKRRENRFHFVALRSVPFTALSCFWRFVLRYERAVSSQQSARGGLLRGEAKRPIDRKTIDRSAADHPVVRNPPLPPKPTLVASPLLSEALRARTASPCCVTAASAASAAALRAAASAIVFLRREGDKRKQRSTFSREGRRWGNNEQGDAGAQSRRLFHPMASTTFLWKKKFRCEKNKPILSPCVISPRTLSPLGERFHLSRTRAGEHALQARRAEERLGRILFFSSCFVANLASFVLSSSSSKVPPIAVAHRT